MSDLGTSPAAAARSPARSWSAWLGWGVLAAFLVFNVPLFLCMPLWPDTSLYDVCARNVLRGGVHYRDIFDNNFPGIVWLHVLIRSLLGWSHEAIRLADLLFLTGSIVLLANWLKRMGRPEAVRVWTALVLYLFYFSTTEMCHCQRDPWALLPALVGLTLRGRQVVRLAAPSTSGSRPLTWACVEGVCWGAAVWIKPQFIVPEFTCWLMSAFQIARACSQGRRRLFSDLAGLLCGGLLAGGLGVAWLGATGAWPAFLEVFLDWNREYVLVRRPWGIKGLVWRLQPWGLVHLIAIPAALIIICQEIASRGRRTPAVSRLERSPALLAALYLGWVLQVLLLQQGFDYHRVPATLLGLTLLTGTVLPPARLGWRILATCMLAGFLAWAAFVHPMFTASRAKSWPRCLRDGSTPELRDQLALTRVLVSTDLRKTREFLAGLNLKDEELTTFDWRTNELLVELDLRPSTRVVTVDSTYNFFPSHRYQIRQELNRSKQRYVVSDLYMHLMTESEALEVGPDGPRSLPPAFPAEYKAVFPWTEPIVFRAGRYLVHRVDGPAKSFAPGMAEPGRQLQN
jgi:hypothetical protein